jgi:hypothetical protein
MTANDSPALAALLTAAADLTDAETAELSAALLAQVNFFADAALEDEAQASHFRRLGAVLHAVAALLPEHHRTHKTAADDEWLRAAWGEDWKASFLDESPGLFLGDSDKEPYDEA